VRYEGLDPGDELLGHLRERRIRADHVRGLRDEVGGACGECGEGGLRVLRAGRCEHNDRAPVATATQRPDRLNAVHQRHLEVHRDEVRRQLFDHRQRDPAIGGRADHLDLRVTPQSIRDDLARHGGVIDHQNTNPRHMSSNIGDQAYPRSPDI